jgi:hypothetical protein
MLEQSIIAVGVYARGASSLMEDRKQSKRKGPGTTYNLQRHVLSVTHFLQLDPTSKNFNHFLK